MKKDDFGSRMKMYEKSKVQVVANKEPIFGNYSDVVNSNLPVFVRLDGKAFHTYTQKFNKPFDENLNKAFQNATINTCKEVGQVLMAYSQSDEVTFLLNGWQKPESQIYFGGKIQKIASVMSSIFTAYFNEEISMINDAYLYDIKEVDPEELHELAFFDARVWNVPEHEIENVFIWRQMDAKRNSIQGLAQSLYSHKELHKKNTKELQSKCYNERGIGWDDLPNIQKWGFVVKKVSSKMPVPNISTGKIIMVNSYKWSVDTEIPYFVDNRCYLKGIIEGTEHGVL